MGPIEQAKEALRGARTAFREHDKVTDDECRLCYRMIDNGLHQENCPITKIDHALRRLNEFQQQIAS